MKTKIVLQCLICVVFLAACGSVTPYPTSLAPTSTFAIPSTKPFPTFTATPTVTQTPLNTPTPQSISGYPTPQPAVLPTCNPIDCLKLEDNVQRQDFTFHDLYLGKYVLRNWCNIDPILTLYPYCAVTISSKGNQQIEIWGWPARFREETGADLTGNGKPDIVITNWSGGNCCVGTIIYEAGDKLEKIMDIGSFRPGTFTDLNEDGTYEYIVPYRLWSRLCSMCDARPSVVFEYQPKSGYVPATHKFKDTLSFNFNEALSFLDKFTKQNPNMPFRVLSANYYYSLTPTAEDEEYLKFDKETNWEYSRALNTLYNITVYYLLAGQPDDAENVLNKYLPSNKATEYMQVVQEELEGLLAP
jgi:hypothetical protein